MSRTTYRPRPAAPRTALVAALVALLALAGGQGRADDRDLLRTGSANPYLFILLDTSASMNRKLGTGGWAPGGADNPDSRLYRAKEALYDVLKDVDDVHFGFASFNQDNVHVIAKHWLYYSDQAVPESGWDLTFPRANAGPLTTTVLEDTDGDGTPDTPTLVTAITGDLLTFGPAFTGTGGRAGACGTTTELNLATPAGRQQLQSFAIDPTVAIVDAPWDDPLAPVNAVAWVKSAKNGKEYRLTARITAGTPGSSTLTVDFRLREKTSGSCTSPTLGAPQLLSRTLQKDANLNQTFVVDSTACGGNPNQQEEYSCLWDYSDVVSSADFGSDHPFTGKGWEGNYDSGAARSGSTNVDRHCQGPPGNPDCVLIKPVLTTALAASPALDYGDVLPFNWDADNKEAFLRRLAPNHDPLGGTAPEFRGAPYFQNVPVANLLRLNDANVQPLLAADKSPLAKAINDFRCWYLGKEGQASGKCRNSAFYDLGWESLACAGDTEFGCRRPYLIIISDGEDNGSGEDATADVAAMFSHSSVKTWALNVGDPRGCNAGGGLHPIVQAGGCKKQAGEECCITVNSREGLRNELQKILGQIRSEVRAFASAAVPSVQATVEQTVTVTSFVPFNDSPVWDGHAHAFVKPVPLLEDGSGRPDTGRSCVLNAATPELATECHLWDAGQVLKADQYDAADPLDLGEAAQRRVFYSIALGTEPGAWPNQRRLFDPTDDTTSQDIRYDLWRGLGIPFNNDIPGPPLQVDQTAQSNANSVVEISLSLKTGTFVDPDTGATQSVTFLLGDTFHSTPQVIGTPSNTLYFAQNLYHDRATDPGVCAADDNTAIAGDPGYRCFLARHQARQRILVFGSDDGMLHAFDAGTFRRSVQKLEFNTALQRWEIAVKPNLFDDGTGKELWAYIPRAVLPTLTEFTKSNKHHYTVDGTVRAADVFIDPVYVSGSPDPDNRQWRTVVIGGLREGGAAYYALDVTQPSPVKPPPTPQPTSPPPPKFVPEDGYEETNVDPFNPPDLVVPRCTGTDTDNNDVLDSLPAGCGPVPYPSPLWEFNDSILESGIRYQLDEDGRVDDASAPVGNGRPDLGATWSTPNIGRIRVCKLGGTNCTPDDPAADGDLVDRFVAIFGGGMDRDSKTTPTAALRGNWLYMVDVETGQAIYKRQLVGAAPSEPAAVDTDQDGYLDRIYLGTIAGKLYRVDLTPVGGSLPALVPTMVKGLDLASGSTATLSTPRIPLAAWAPHLLFDTREGAAPDATPTGPYRPIYHRPSVIFVAKLGLYALAFGTGDREDLWSLSGGDGRFYVFVDSVPAFTAATLSPAITDQFMAIPRDAAFASTSDDFLLGSTRGWKLELGTNERVITDAFALSGVTVFSSYIPKTVGPDGQEINSGCSAGGTGQGGGGGGGGGGGNNPPAATCSRAGNSQIFVVNTTNAYGFLVDVATSVKTRYRVLANFVTNPFAEPSSSKAPSGSGSGGGGPTHNADQLTANLTEIMNTLKALFPANCKFANYRIDVKTIASDTSLEFIAPVPVCIIERNWKEF